MNQTEQQITKKTFHNDMIALYKRTRKELKYTPPQLFEMITKYEGYEAAIKFIITDMNTFVFSLLWEHQRLDLSVEALITKETYKDLFPEDIIKFCEKRLQEYNYAPNILPIVHEEVITPYTEEEHMFDSCKNGISTLESDAKEQKHTIYDQSIPITTHQWETLFSNDTIFTSKNKDLILRMFLMGGRYITHNVLAQEEGYNDKYPFKEVVTAIGKRIKSTLKIDMPVNTDNKAIPWHILFIGWFEGNTAFSWSLRPEFFLALQNLIDSGVLSIVGITVSSHEEILSQAADYAIPMAISAEIIPSVEHTPSLEVDKEIVEDRAELHFDDDLSDDLSIPALELDDLPFEDDVYSDLGHLYQTTDSEEHSDKPNRQPLSAISLDDLIDSIFDGDEPSPKASQSIAAPSKPAPKQPTKAPQVVVQPAKIEPAEEPCITEVVSLPSDKSLDEVKKSCIEYYGAVCDLCGFDFGYTYGEQFEELITIYAIDGLDIASRLDQIDPQKDLIPICSNCKQVIESKSPHYTVEEIKKVIK